MEADDPELRLANACLATKISERGSLDPTKFVRCSCWLSLRRDLATLTLGIRRYQWKKSKIQKTKSQRAQSNAMDYPRRSLELLKQAEWIIVKTVQSEYFADEISELSNATALTYGQPNYSNIDSLKKSSLYRLDPFLDTNGVLRVGGRLRQSNEEYAEKHPAILPKKHHLSRLIIHHFHEKVRNGGCWIIGASRTVSKMLSNCVTCRKLRGKFLTQHIADLPPDRTETPPPFTNVGFDVFGPWTIYAKRTRGGTVNAKRWGIIFTSMNSRAIHIEVLETLDSSSFICSLRRFLSIRGPVSLLRSDCGTNFIGGKSELDDASKEEELVIS